jgi:hypothetical protein
MASTKKTSKKTKAMTEKRRLQERVRNLEATLKHRDHQMTGLIRMLACVKFLSKYFGHVAVIEFQHTEQFGSILSLEAGGLAFDTFQPRHGNFEAMVYSAEDTEIKLVCTSLPLDDNGHIGLEALSAIKLRQEAITPEGRKKFLRLNPSTFGRLYQDLYPAQRQRRSQLLTERCMRHIQVQQPEPQRQSGLMGRLHPESSRMSLATAAVLRMLEEGNVTVLRPEYLSHLLAAFSRTLK